MIQWMRRRSLQFSSGIRKRNNNRNKTWLLMNIRCRNWYKRSNLFLAQFSCVLQLLRNNSVFLYYLWFSDIFSYFILSAYSPFFNHFIWYVTVRHFSELDFIEMEEGGLDTWWEWNYAMYWKRYIFCFWHKVELNTNAVWGINTMFEWHRFVKILYFYLTLFNLMRILCCWVL